VALRRSLVGFLVHSSLLAQSGVITTIAGRTPVNGAPVRGFDGDGGPALAAALSLANLQNTCDPNRFEQTSHIAVDAKSNIYFTDSNGQRIRRIDPSGVITTIAGTGDQPGPACQAPGPVNDGGKALAARLFNPADVVVHPNGSLLIADQQNNRIRQITASGTISTIAGSGSHNLYAPGIPATTSPMDWPSSLVIDANGLIYFAEEHSNRIGKIGADGKLSTVVDLDPTKFTATLNKPMGIAFDRNGGLLIADTGNHRIRRVDPSGAITTIAGSGREAFCGDGGPAINACFDTPMDVKADALGNIFVADTGNNRVRRIDPSGTITTVAGTGIPGRGADGIAATASALNFPCALALDADGSLYIVDWQNYLIRKVTFAAAPSIAAGGSARQPDLDLRNESQRGERCRSQRHGGPADRGHAGTDQRPVALRNGGGRGHSGSGDACRTQRRRDLHGIADRLRSFRLCRLGPGDRRQPGQLAELARDP
jgi:sugar lactone lactonase YvrE